MTTNDPKQVFSLINKSVIKLRIIDIRIRYGTKVGEAME